MLSSQHRDKDSQVGTSSFSLYLMLALWLQPGIKNCVPGTLKEEGETGFKNKE